MMLKKLDLDVLGLAETFLQREEEIEIGGYTWYGHNRQECKRASGGVGVLVKKNLKSLPLKSQTDGWCGLKLGWREEKNWLLEWCTSIQRE